jgi:large subunit ribosomal protein LP0
MQNTFLPEILDITDTDLLVKFQASVANVAALSLAINYPNMASVLHSIVNGMKNLLAIKEAKTVKAFLADPSAIAAVAPAAAAAAPAAAAKAALPPEEESEEENDDMGFGLFD